MPKKQSSTPTHARKPRADAQRNRERILEVARLAFTRHGAEATLDEIARQAGIGSGTLYRHFPTRDALIEAVYGSEVEKLTAAGQRFAVTMSPLEALRAWMLLFIDHVASKRLILPAMDTVAGGSMRLIEGARGHIHGAFLALVQRAIRSGDLRSDTEPNDFVRALVGVFHTTALPGWEPSARRIVDNPHCRFAPKDRLVLINADRSCDADLRVLVSGESRARHPNTRAILPTRYGE